MLTKIEQTKQFRRDFKREKKGQHRDTFQSILSCIVESLMNETTLDQKYHDHSLSGQWKDCRDCHIKPDLILIYRVNNNKVLQLIRIGSHSELGL